MPGWHFWRGHPACKWEGWDGAAWEGKMARFDVLLMNGEVIDGTGRERFRADVGIRDGKITDVGDLAGSEATEELDCRGLCVSPGWVDIHGHADWTVLDYSVGMNLLIQGCTTTVAGNCGDAPAPMHGPATTLLQQGALGETKTLDVLSRRFPSGAWSFGEYLDAVDESPLGLNFVQLVGHNQLRASVMGHDQRAASEHELGEMKRLLEACLDEGALGLSSGLVFIPGCWSESHELTELCKVVASRDLLYASHIRGERETNIEATQEIIDTARDSGVRAQISHMESKYPVLGNCVRKMEMLQDARDQGADIACDSEAFPDHMADPGYFLQIYAYGPEELLRRMSSIEGRRELKQRMRSIDPWHPLGRFGPGGVPFRRAWDRVIVFDCPHDRNAEAKTVAAVAVHRGIDPEDALFDLAVGERGTGPLLVYDYIEDDHYRTAPWPHCIFPSVDQGLFDPGQHLTPAALRFWKETRFPGSIGLFPRVLGQFAREEQLMTFEEAVRKMSGLAMQRLGIVDRGVIAKGKCADLTVFDPQSVSLRGSALDPSEVKTFFPVGIRYVLVNGRLAVRDHELTGAAAGRLIRE
jgi:N-acyl-D-amino-acid deacylase